MEDEQEDWLVIRNRIIVSKYDPPGEHSTYCYCVECQYTPTRHRTWLEIKKAFHASFELDYRVSRQQEVKPTWVCSDATLSLYTVLEQFERQSLSLIFGGNSNG